MRRGGRLRLLEVFRCRSVLLAGLKESRDVPRRRGRVVGNVCRLNTSGRFIILLTDVRVIEGDSMLGDCRRLNAVKRLLLCLSIVIGNAIGCEI